MGSPPRILGDGTGGEYAPTRSVWRRGSARREPFCSSARERRDVGARQRGSLETGGYVRGEFGEWCQRDRETVRRGLGGGLSGCQTGGVRR
ncbi:MAG: hypothetical protein ACHQ7M_03945 [Chloroflexota bacterium]